MPPRSSSPPRGRPEATSRPQRPGVRAAAVVVLCGLLATGCSLDRDDEPATVTVPRLNTTTSTLPPSVAPEEEAEPLPIVWIVQLGGPEDERLDAIAGYQDRAVAVGSAAGDLGGAALGGQDAIVVVVDSDGAVRAVQRYGSGEDDVATGVTANGDAVVVCGDTLGGFGGPTGGGADLWCATLDRPIAAGSTRAEEVWELAAPIQLGGGDDERAGAVALGTDVGYLAGSVSGVMPGALDSAGRGLGGGDAVVLQLDVEGRAIWARQFGTTFGEAATGATTTADDDGIVVGWTDGSLEGPSLGGRDAWITRFDPSGNQRWLTQVGSGGDDEFTAVAALGEARRGTEQFVGVGRTTGDVDDPTAAARPSGDVLVASFGTDGALQWIRQFGSDGDDAAAAVVADGSNLYVVGTTTGGLGELVSELGPDALGGPGGGSDGFVAQLDAATGQVRWIGRFGSTADDVVTGAAATADGLLVVSGTTSGQLGEDPYGGGLDAFVLALPLAAAGGGAASSV